MIGYKPGGDSISEGKNYAGRPGIKKSLVYYLKKYQRRLITFVS